MNDSHQRLGGSFLGATAQTCPGLLQSDMGQARSVKALSLQANQGLADHLRAHAWWCQILCQKHLEKIIQQEQSGAGSRYMVQT